MADIAMSRLEQQNHPYPNQHIRLSGAQHNTGVPNLPANIPGYVFDGFNPAVNARASARAWRAMLDFII